jgi:6-phosphogluconate dehydrogenase
MMPGGSEDAYPFLEPIVTKVAAQVDDGPCVTYIGKGGAGNYVKMVHNGIEYGDMQLIAEAYDVLKNVGGLTNAEIASTFAEWNKSELESFLTQITAIIFTVKDDQGSGKDLVDMILDKTGSKGTGKWTVKEAAEMATPAACIAAALDARYVRSVFRSSLSWIGKLHSMLQA